MTNCKFLKWIWWWGAHPVLSMLRSYFNFQLTWPIQMETSLGGYWNISVPDLTMHTGNLLPIQSLPTLSFYCPWHSILRNGHMIFIEGGRRIGKKNFWYFVLKSLFLTSNLCKLMHNMDAGELQKTGKIRPVFFIRGEVTDFLKIKFEKETIFWLQLYVYGIFKEHPAPPHIN